MCLLPERNHKKSSEHIIQNAIGGILESVDICCPECNLAVEKFVDKDFVKIFSPITNNIDYLPKRASTESCYDGQVMCACFAVGRVRNRGEKPFRDF